MLRFAAMDVFDSQGERLVVGAVRGRGGEATVYQVRGRPNLVAKIYTPPPRRGYETKLAWMRANPPQDPGQPLGHASIAWPQDLLYDGRGKFAGYAMPYIPKAARLLEVFNPRLRAKTLPGFDRKYLHRAARNIAAAVAALHDEGYVVGDLNESNILVTPAALVTVIDADSFQVQEEQDARIIFYPCPVGKPEYTPPELQGKSFRRVVRQPDHDRFGLAVLIFQLLMDGSHPFRCRWLADGDPPSVGEKISRGWFPYASEARGPVAPPPASAALEALHPALAALLIQCFEDGHHHPGKRPAAEEWRAALANAEDALSQCPKGHWFSDHLSECPYCGHQTVQVAAVPSPPFSAPASKPFAAPAPRPQSGSHNPAVRGSTSQAHTPRPARVPAPQQQPPLASSGGSGGAGAWQPSFTAPPSQPPGPAAHAAPPAVGTPPPVTPAPVRPPGSSAPPPHAGPSGLPGPSSQSSSGTQPCPRCGHPVALGDLYCRNCLQGMRIATVTCPSCHRANPAGETHCQSCAAPLAGGRRCTACGYLAPGSAANCPNCGQRF